MKEITLQATLENTAVVTAFAEQWLTELGCPVKALMQINIAIDELFSNIARYAYPTGVGDATVRLETAEDLSEIRISFIDSGVPYDPLLRKDPDVTLSSEDRAIGGLGIYMVKKSMDSVSYEYKDGCNCITIVKKISRG